MHTCQWSQPRKQENNNQQSYVWEFGKRSESYFKIAAQQYRLQKGEDACRGSEQEHITSQKVHVPDPGSQLQRQGLAIQCEEPRLERERERERERELVRECLFFYFPSTLLLVLSQSRKHTTFVGKKNLPIYCESVQMLHTRNEKANHVIQV
jgi:hypothetical protein